MKKIKNELLDLEGMATDFELMLEGFVRMSQDGSLDKIYRERLLSFYIDLSSKISDISNMVSSVVKENLTAEKEKKLC